VLAWQEASMDGVILFTLVVRESVLHGHIAARSRL
jgi:hypothetical protein